MVKDGKGKKIMQNEREGNKLAKGKKNRKKNQGRGNKESKGKGKISMNLENENITSKEGKEGEKIEVEEKVESVQAMSGNGDNEKETEGGNKVNNKDDVECWKEQQRTNEEPERDIISPSKEPKRKAAMFLVHPSEMRKYQDEYAEGFKNDSSKLQLPSLFQEETEKNNNKRKIDTKHGDQNKDGGFPILNVGTPRIMLSGTTEEIPETKFCEIHLETQMKIEIRKKDFSNENDEESKNDVIKKINSELYEEDKIVKKLNDGNISDEMDKTRNNVSSLSLSPVKKLSSNDVSPCGSRLSPFKKLTLTGSSTVNKSTRGTHEIIKAFRDLNLSTKADDLEKKLLEMQKSFSKLRDSIKEARKEAEMALEDLKQREREYARIRKMKIAYKRYKQKEKARQLRIEMQKRMKIEREKRMIINRKLHEERFKLALENNISRQYNFSYFGLMKPKRGRKDRILNWHSSSSI